MVGTAVSLALLDRGDEVIGIDRRPNTWTDRIEMRSVDLRNAGLDDFKVGAKPDIVLHLAANAKVFELVEHPERAMDNVRVVFNVLDYCRAEEIPIIFASSREVYGDIQHHVTQESYADFVVAESPYSASKIAGEAFIYSFSRCYALPHLVFRFSNVYGRYDCDIDRMERVIPLFAQRIAAGEPIVVYGREKVLDFTYIDDCVAGVVAGMDALLNGKVWNETINLATGQGFTLVDVVNLLGLAIGKEPNVTFEPTRAGEVTKYVADLTKAKSLLGYKPTTPLTGGLAKGVAWQREIGVLPPR